MVALAVTPAITPAVDLYNTLRQQEGHDDHHLNDCIEHHELAKISKYLVHHSVEQGSPTSAWRLDTLLKGTSVHRPRPPLPAEKAGHFTIEHHYCEAADKDRILILAQTAEYKALMARLRHQEEQRQYDRMIYASPQPETFTQRFPNARSTFTPGTSLHQEASDDVDEVTYADVNRQMILIINVLVSIIACSIAVWIAARRWSTPQRMGLSFFSSALVAFAEVAIYMGYVHRIKTAKSKEVKSVETKEVVDTWVIDHKSSSAQANHTDSNIRFRKGKHR